MSTEEMSETTTTNYNYENVNADAASISIRGDIVRSDAEPTDVVPATSNGTAGMLNYTLYNTLYICFLSGYILSGYIPLVCIKQSY